MPFPKGNKINLGRIPWNKGKVGTCKPNSGSFKKGEHRSRKTEFKKGSMVRWKGENAGYVSKHTWVAKKLGKPYFCEHCQRRDLPHRSYHWANISGEYKRDLADWKRLCVKCHKIFDKKPAIPRPPKAKCECGVESFSKGMCQRCYQKNYRKIKS